MFLSLAVELSSETTLQRPLPQNDSEKLPFCEDVYVVELSSDVN